MSAEQLTPAHVLEAMLTESQSNLRDTIAICRQLLTDKAALIAWQQDAVETLQQWYRCIDLVPSSRRPVGARAADCVFAYIDHLQEELLAARDECRTLRRACQTFGEQAAALEEPEL